MRDLAECTVLVVDDTEANIDILVETLGADYDISVAMDGPSALELVEEDRPDLILLDIMMPGMDGYEVCSRLKDQPYTRDIPIIFVTAMGEVEDETKGLGLGAIDYVTKPISPPIVRARVRNHLELKLAQEAIANQNVILEQKVRERTRELALTQDATIFTLSSLAETRDPETGGHIHRTQNYVKALAEHMKSHDKYREALNDHAVELLFKSAPLHDVGKVGVPDNILLKPGRLTLEEFEEMKKHTLYGHNALLHAEELLGFQSFLHLAREVAYTHHEKWNGEGYPAGLKGDDIPLSGRIMAIADVYDALISKRVYKKPFSHRKAVSILTEERGIHFDPDLLDGFLEIEEEFRQIALTFADFDEERAALEGRTEDDG